MASDERTWSWDSISSIFLQNEFLTVALGNLEFGSVLVQLWRLLFFMNLLQVSFLRDATSDSVVYPSSSGWYFKIDRDVSPHSFWRRFKALSTLEFHSEAN
jgi:hypothetical protein